jgi:hypothetical protein
MSQTQVKRETSLAKIGRKAGRPKATESAARGRAHDAGDATLIPSLSAGQQRRGAYTPEREA